MNRFKLPWRIEGRASPFLPFIIVEFCASLEEALKAEPRLKASYRFYATRIRAN